MSAVRGLRRLLVALAFLALGGGFLVLDLTPTSTAGTEPGSSPARIQAVPAVAPALAPTLALAATTETTLGLPSPASRTVERLTDASSAQVFDEVTDLDPAGTPIGISRFDPSGGLISSIRLGYLAQPSTSISATAAGQAAAGISAKVGFAVQGTSAVTARASGGWLARWTRQVGGVPAPGDGVAVQLDADGTFHAIVQTKHGLAPLPATTIDASHARQLATGRLDGWFPADVRADLAIGSVSQAWIAPNDTFGDPLPAGSAGVLRLAWVVRVTVTGTMADTVAGLELAFDAGTGASLGGDMLE